ncbi:MAG: hypothetical protein GDYSWBUE_000416 [Candidatus Fervidibacterota bacterium]
MLGRIKCRRIRNLFVEYADGSLQREPKLLSAFQEHLNMCDECRRALESYTAVVAALRSISSDGIAPPQGVYERTCEAVLKRVGGLPSGGSIAWRRLPAQLAFVFGAASILAMAVFAIYSRTGIERRIASVEMAAPTARSVGERKRLTPAPPSSSVLAVVKERSGMAKPQVALSTTREQRAVKIARAQIQRRQPSAALNIEPVPLTPRSFHESVEKEREAPSLERPLALRGGVTSEVELPEPIAVEAAPKSAEEVGERAEARSSRVSSRLTPPAAPLQVVGEGHGESPKAKGEPTKLAGQEGQKGQESPHGLDVPKPLAKSLNEGFAAAGVVPPDVERAAEEKLKDIHRRQPSAVHAIQESSTTQPPVEVEVSQASPAVLNQRGLWLMSLRPRQNLENVRVLAYAPKFIDASAVEALLFRRQAADSQSPSPPRSPQLSIPLWEGNLVENKLQPVPVPINPLVPGTHEVRLVIESANKAIGSWLVLYPVAKSLSQFTEDVGRRIVSVNARDWRLVDLCRYLANQVGSVIILPAELADIRVSLSMQNVQYERLVKTLANQLSLQARLSGNVTAISSHRESLQIESQQGR